MTERSTPCGQLLVGPQEFLFARAATLLADLHAAAARPPVCALSGGGTPQAWFHWCLAQRALPARLTATTHFTVSDERHVPLASDQSNFGNATRGLLDPLAVPAAYRHAWPVALPPAEAAAAYGAAMEVLTGPGRAYDLCFLGLGEDAHTASLFPGSPLLADRSGGFFTAVDVPGKGGRLTITPAGLRTCSLIMVLVLGAGKAEALQRVLLGPDDVGQTPGQILKACADRVIWLVDEAAAARL